ncbi:MAG: LuxR C-terminal-related transcriptional regulator, partial [Thermoleophilaceae bacterium]
EEVLTREQDEPEALDGLGQSLWWLGETQASVELRAKAFAAYQRAGDHERAAYLATYLAAEYRIAGNASLAQGWLGRAQRLLEGTDECAALGWLHIELSKRAADPLDAEKEGQRALELARRIGDSDIEAAALSHVGLARVSQGRVEEGMAVLDEAMAAATGGEAEDPLAVGEACCITLVACEQLADVRRARDFGRAVSDFAARRNYLPLSAWCRAVYALFLVASGRWQDAEREFERALGEYGSLAETNPLTAIAGLAQLRIRQGRLEEAAQLLAGSEDRPGAAETMVRLHLARGQVELASERLAQRLEGAGDGDAYSAPLIALRGSVELARERVEAASEAAAALQRLAERLGREDLSAVAEIQLAGAARMAGQAVRAKALEEAAEVLARLELPLEEGEARAELARALATSRPELAVQSARAALAIFERLGAARHADDTAGFLRELGAPGRPAPRTPGELTRRESEVLELLAVGLSNPEIAERLVIAPKTAEHHVGRVLSKLGLRNRAEAAAYAVRARAEGGTL